MGTDGILYLGLMEGFFFVDIILQQQRKQEALVGAQLRRGANPHG